MNNSVPNWNFDSDSCITNQKKPVGPERELVELLWQNGEVVLHSQPQRKPNRNSIDSRQIQKIDGPLLRTSVSYGNPSNLVREYETVSWIQYPQEDPLQQGFCSNFLYELQSCDESDKSIKQSEEATFVKFGAYGPPHVTASLKTPSVKLSTPQEFSGNPMPASRFHFPSSSQNNPDQSGSQRVANFSLFSAPPRFASTSSDAKLGDKGTANLLKSEARECLAMTIGSSYCGSNQIPRDVDVSHASSNGAWTAALSAESEPFKDDVHRTIPHGVEGKLETLEPTVTSSSGGSGISLGRICCQSTRVHGQKRKVIDAEEFEEQSEVAELKSAAENKASQRTGSSRRNRAAEVHNLSERRRRDRINEKMRALQQLIPHSNKTDKASMLDEAIEYLKSLQLQLQVLWMGTGMTPMMFPGIQHYLSQIGMGMAAPFFPPIHNPMHSPRVPLDQPISVTQTPNQTVMCQTSVLGPFNYQNQMQNPALLEQYARYQPMNLLRYVTSQAAQHDQSMIPPSNSSGAAITDDAVNGKMVEPLE